MQNFPFKLIVKETTPILGYQNSKIEYIKCGNRYAKPCRNYKPEYHYIGIYVISNCVVAFTETFAYSCKITL